MDPRLVLTYDPTKASDSVQALPSHPPHSGSTSSTPSSSSSSTTLPLLVSTTSTKSAVNTSSPVHHYEDLSQTPPNSPPAHSKDFYASLLSHHDPNHGNISSDAYDPASTCIIPTTSSDSVYATYTVDTGNTDDNSDDAYDPSINFSEPINKEDNPTDAITPHSASSVPSSTACNNHSKPNTSDTSTIDESSPKDAPRILKFCTVCASNNNRSMEAHRRLSALFPVLSFGTGSLVRLPGPSISQPNVYPFNTTAYAYMYEDLEKKDARLYRANGLLAMLARNKSIKWGPERWQDWRIGYPRVTDRFMQELGASGTEGGAVDIVITCEERCWDAVVDDLHQRGGLLNRPVHVINVDIRDSHEDAVVGAEAILDLANSLESFARAERYRTGPCANLSDSNPTSSLPSLCSNPESNETKVPEPRDVNISTSNVTNTSPSTSPTNNPLTTAASSTDPQFQSGDLDKALTHESISKNTTATCFDEQVPSILACWQKRWPHLPALWTLAWL